MCGIVGLIDLSRRPVAASLAVDMADAIAHRGPDDEGYVAIDQATGLSGEFSGPDSPADVRAAVPPLSPAVTPSAANLALGHRRFSIVDLSAAGHQPLFDHDRACCVVFNGEIYNYVELRDELVRLGARFRTRSDTEVLLEAYKQWGAECFARFNGFWAIALYDFRRSRLLLSRDRVGKKPLFWTRVGATVYFASEIKALLRVPEVHSRRRPNPEAAYHWLAYGRKNLGNATAFEGIYAFPAGTWAAVDEHFPGNAVRYWSLPERRRSERSIPIAEAADTVRALLTDAVRLRLRADVPVGLELSGGLDSSTLVALAAQVSGRRVTTYTVRFPDPQWNEEPFARSVADRYGVDYRVLDSPSAGFWGDIGAFTRLEEEPYHAPNLHTNQVIWSQMRGAGTKVSLNGAAGDELFAGYGGYYGPAQVENLLRGRVGTFARNAMRHSEGTSAARALAAPLSTLLREGAKRTGGGVLARARPRPAHVRDSVAWRVNAAGGATLSRALYRDMTDTLMPYWLTSGDRGFMGVPVEVRAPFLDYRLVDYVFTLPTSYLLRDGWHKWILRKAFEGLLPEDVLWRRRKLGFPFWFERFYERSAALIDMAFDAADNPFVDTAARGAARRDWRAISFVLWYELFFNENLALFADLEARARRDGSPDEWGARPGYLDHRR